MSKGSLPDPESILRHSIENPEPPLDPAYGREDMVITSDPSKPNQLMTANRAILDLITAYGVAARRNDQSFCGKCVAEIESELETPKINNSEFACFWVVNDTSYSVYKRMTPTERHVFLHEVIRRYLANRHTLYLGHGYSATTLQVNSDSFAHKRSGNLARQKVGKLLQEAQFQHDKLFLQTGQIRHAQYIMPDKKVYAQAYAGMMDKLGAKSTLMKSLDKKPDFAFRFGDRLWIVEHKHMKEFGGGQDKQITELIQFIKQHEPSAVVSYVAFMDGILFNHLMASKKKGKAGKQRTSICDTITSGLSNYFVNTAGFRLLLREITDTSE